MPTAIMMARLQSSIGFQPAGDTPQPHDFSTNPHLCVFEGEGSRIFPKLNVCPLSVGRDFKLDETIKLAVNAKNAVCMWGPYEISKDGFDLGVKRLRLLAEGTIKYRADDPLYRKDRIAINCFHAMASTTATPNPQPD